MVIKAYDLQGEYDKAVHLYHKGGDYPKALDLCFKAGEIDPSQSKVMFDLMNVVAQVKYECCSLTYIYIVTDISL